MTRRSQVALAVLLLLCHPAAHADDHALAHQLADEAKALVKRGEFRPGVEKLWAAYSADPDPHILFNLGVTYEVLARAGGADDIRHGIDCFERFVKALLRHKQPRCPACEQSGIEWTASGETRDSRMDKHPRESCCVGGAFHARFVRE